MLNNIVYLRQLVNRNKNGITLSYGDSGERQTHHQKKNKHKDPALWVRGEKKKKKKKARQLYGSYVEEEEKKKQNQKTRLYELEER